MASRCHSERQWRDELDQRLIDFWRQHECLYDSSKACYHNKRLKTRLWSEFASSMGLSFDDVERRSRSLRTQYGRLIGHPEKLNTKKKRMLKEQLGFLRPYIVPRRCADAREDGFEEEDGDEDEEEEDTEGSMETGSVSASPLHTDGPVPDPGLKPQCAASTLPPASFHHQPHVTEVVPPHCHCRGERSPPDKLADGPKEDVLGQFVKVMLSDMHQIKDTMVLMRLRRDITRLVFEAVEHDMRKRPV
ncbi:uncharacterized protein LOC115379585 [Myripristis murdjan]|uniref:uncharacterized protein LOC115379585 n=1 Tax=Myripristis murdjan TaxID=586833 RepID=UPI0011763F76|nr:uncharacterized protein LOC115379585 [Myripristis murdjan]